MRPIQKEYNIDWRIWAVLKNTGGLKTGTEKELDTLMRFSPESMKTRQAMVDMAGDAARVVAEANAGYMHNIITAHEQGKKLALVTYNFSPIIVYAMDIVPICLEMMSGMVSTVIQKDTGEYLDYCTEVGFPETACSGQRLGLGPILAGLTEKPDMVLYSTCGVCDSNAAAYAFASEYLDIPVCQLNYPPVLLDPDTVAYQRADFKNLLAFLEEQTGTRLDVDKLREVCNNLNQEDRLISEIQDLERLVPNPVPSIHNLFLYAVKLMFSGSQIAIDTLKLILANAEENARKGISGNGYEKLRGLWCYIDHYCDDTNYFITLARQGVSHVGCMMTDFWQPNAPISKGREEESYKPIDTTSLDTMIDGLAEQTARLPMIKQIRGPYDAPNMWMDDTLGAARLFKADFMVFMGTFGCRNTWGMVKPFAREMEKAGIPTLISYSDSFDNRIESSETIIDNTFEFLKVRGLLND